MVDITGVPRVSHAKHLPVREGIFPIFPVGVLEAFYWLIEW